MLELVFVIVILGIVASIGADIISKLYENFIQTKAINKTLTQTDTVLNQIAKRLQFRIKESTIARKSDGTKIELQNATNDNYTILEWIGVANEAFLGDWNGSKVVPGYSGFVDLDSNETNKSQIKTVGSRLDFAEIAIYNLSYTDINISLNTTPSAVLIFKGQDFNDITKFGYDGNGSSSEYAYKIQRAGIDVLKFTDKNASTIYEQYNLAYSAYAIVPEGSNEDFNLTLYYNYQPWDGDQYSSTDTKKSTLAEHVTSFKFTQIGNTIRLKLCIKDPMIEDEFGVCKERVVF